MNVSLFLSSFKMNAKNIFSYAFGSVFYMWLLTWVFPSIKSSQGVDNLIKSMPAGLLKATGLQNGITNLNDYLASEFYGVLFVIVMIVYCVMISTQLMARLVDHGSMAYLLATPVSRTKVAMTQVCVAVLGLIIIIAFTAFGGLLGIKWFVTNPELDTQRFLQINLIGGLIFFVISGYSFLFSSFLNDEKQALGVSAVVTVLFYGMDMIGKLSDKFDWLRKLSLFHLFRPEDIAAGTMRIWPTALLLTLIGLVLYAISIIGFKKRDLPL